MTTLPETKSTIDESIIKRCQQGDVGAFRLVYEKEKIRMYNLALRITGHRDDAEDCLQDAFVKLFRSMGQFKGHSKFETWLYRIVMTTCLNHVNRKKVHSSLEEESRPFYLTAESDLEQKEIESAIQSLSPDYKVVFVMYEIEGFNHSEIAGMLNITVGTSKSRLSRAKAMLREKLENDHALG